MVAAAGEAEEDTWAGAAAVMGTEVGAGVDGEVLRALNGNTLEARADVGEVTGMGRVVVVDLVMKAGGTHLRLKEAAVAGLDREVVVVADLGHVQVVRVLGPAKPLCNGQAAVLALKKYLNRQEVVHWPSLYLGTQKH